VAGDGDLRRGDDVDDLRTQHVSDA
jgi:hypothetical protein